MGKKFVLRTKSWFVGKLSKESCGVFFGSCTLYQELQMLFIPRAGTGGGPVEYHSSISAKVMK